LGIIKVISLAPFFLPSFGEEETVGGGTFGTISHTVVEEVGEEEEAEEEEEEDDNVDCFRNRAYNFATSLEIWPSNRGLKTKETLLGTVTFAVEVKEAADVSPSTPKTSIDPPFDITVSALPLSLRTSLNVSASIG